MITITKIWFDNRADRIISPSKEATEYMIKNGIDREKIATFGLPVREGFNPKINSKEKIRENTNINGKLKILILNNSENRLYSRNSKIIFRKRYIDNESGTYGNNRSG